MFIVSLNYVASPGQIDSRMVEHVKFLQKHYQAGTFLTSGRKVPRTGGIILAVGNSKVEIETIMNEDPFVKFKLAKVEVTEFQNSQMSPGFRKMMEELQVTGNR